MPIIVETPDRSTALPFIFLWIDVLDSVASAWIKGCSHWLRSCPAAPNPLPMKPARNRRVNPPLVTHRDIHTAHRYKYTPSMHTHTHKKPSSPRGWRVRQAIKGTEQMPTCSPWTWPCLSYARVPGVAPGCLNTLFPSVAWIWRAEMSKYMGISYPLPQYLPIPL